MQKGSDRAVEAAQKAINSPLLETSINGAKGVIMNITGGMNLSLFEVQEAADIVASASHEDLNMIFGSVINENLKDEIIITVIATGFTEQEDPRPQTVPQPVMEETIEKPRMQDNQVNFEKESASYDRYPEQEKNSLDIPAFFRRRNRR